MNESRQTVLGTAAAADINVRAHGYFVALAVATCGSCQSPSRLLALVLPPDHQYSAADERLGGDEESCRDAWETVSCVAFLFFVAALPSSVQQRLRSIAPAYRETCSGEAKERYWANHCECCGSRFDDQELFCEPDGAFLPTSAAAAAAIDLMRIDEPFEAATAGCAYEPQFFSCMREI